MRNFVGFEIVGAFSAEGGISNMVVSSDISDHREPVASRSAKLEAAVARYLASVSNA